MKLGDIGIYYGIKEVFFICEMKRSFNNMHLAHLYLTISDWGDMRKEEHNIIFTDGDEMTICF